MIKKSFLSLLVLLIFSSYLVPKGFTFQEEVSISEEKAIEQLKKKLIRQSRCIMTDDQIDVLLSLESINEINIFMDEFWNEKDPVKDTPENELRIEYYNRAEYADSVYREGRIPGSETDRGRVYIIYGSPADIRFDTGTIIRDSELWLYNKHSSGGETRGTIFFEYFPGMMKFAFYDKYGVGIYKQIYSTEKGEHIDPIVYLNQR